VIYSGKVRCRWIINGFFSCPPSELVCFCKKGKQIIVTAAKPRQKSSMVVMSPTLVLIWFSHVSKNYGEPFLHVKRIHLARLSTDRSCESEPLADR